MKKHILLEKAYCYTEPIEVEMPKRYIFDEEKGYWRDIETNKIMMLSEDMRKQQTKKQDRETGEDQKGE